MSVYQTCLIGRTKITDGPLVLQYKKTRLFNFKPGQYIDLTIPDPEHQVSSRITHAFSIASSPLGQDLLVTTRMRSTLFKRTLAGLPIATAAHIGGPKIGR